VHRTVCDQVFHTNSCTKPKRGKLGCHKWNREPGKGRNRLQLVKGVSGSTSARDEETYDKMAS
jgi:hypothetical protein